jgi:hypothetical protein
MADCIEWAGARNTEGYGYVQVGPKLLRAHRVAYERERGPIPAGLVIDHLCGNPPCVNVSHLRAVSNRENVRAGKSTRLNLADARAIRASSEPQRVLAARYRVSQSHISRIKSGDRNAWIEEA